MPDPLDGLTPAQRQVVAHRGGPLVVVGAAGTGKTRALRHRHAWLATEGGLAPEQVLALTSSEAAADAMRAGVEDELDRGFEELAVHTVHGFGARLLRDEALEAGLDPFVVPVTPADRLAMLLERVDELTLQLHDFQGSPAALLAAVIARIDRLKEAMVTAAEVTRWAAALPAEDDRAEREREFAAVYAAHDRMLREQGALDFGDLLLAVVTLLRDKPHVRARAGARWRHVLVDDVQDLELAAVRLVLLLGGQQRGRTPLEVVELECELVDALQQHGQAIGGRDAHDERIQARLQSLVAQQARAESVDRVDRQLLEPALELVLHARAHRVGRRLRRG